MSYLEVLILRHLFRGPAHGYEIRKRVEATTGTVLHNNTLYPALRRFEEAGALTKTAREQEGRPPRHVYELTAVGRELLHDLLAELPAELAGDDREFMTRFGQFALLTPAERRAILDARDTALREQLDRLTSLQARAGADRWGPLITAELIRRTEDERAWLAGLRPLAGEDLPGSPGGEDAGSGAG